MIFQWIFILASCFGLVWLGWIIQEHSLLADLNTLIYAKVIFACVFGLSCFLFEIILLEVTQLTPPSLLVSCCAWSLNLLITTLLLASPAIHCATYCHQKLRFGVWGTIVCTSAVLMLFNFLFWRASGILYANDAVTKRTWIPSLVQTVTAGASVGTWISACLSGYGSVKMPYNYLSLFVRPVTQSHIRALEQQITYTANEREKHQRMLNELQAAQSAANTRNSQGSLNGDGVGSQVGRVWHRLVAATTGDKETSVINLKQQISGLSAFQSALHVELKQAQIDHQRAIESRQVTGHLKNLLGYVLSLYCIIRVLVSIKSLIFAQDSSQDPVSRLVSVWVSTAAGLKYKLDTDTLAQRLTMTFIIYISVASLRAFLINVGKLFYSVSGVASGPFLQFCLSEMIGFYALTTFMMTKSNLAERHRDIINQAIGGDVTFTGLLRGYNAIYLATAASTITLFYYQWTQSKPESDSLPMYYSDASNSGKLKLRI